MQTASEKATLTQRRYDDTQGDQGLVDVRAFCQSVPAVVGIRSLAVRHSKSSVTFTVITERSSATRGQLC